MGLLFVLFHHYYFLELIRVLLIYIRRKERDHNYILRRWNYKDISRHRECLFPPKDTCFLRCFNLLSSLLSIKNRKIVHASSVLSWLEKTEEKLIKLMAEGKILLHLGMSSWALQRLNIVIFNGHTEATLAKSEDWIFLLIAQVVRCTFGHLGSSEKEFPGQECWRAWHLTSQKWYFQEKFMPYAFVNSGVMSSALNSWQACGRE